MIELIQNKIQSEWQKINPDNLRQGVWLGEYEPQKYFKNFDQPQGNIIKSWFITNNSIISKPISSFAIFMNFGIQNQPSLWNIGFAEVCSFINSDNFYFSFTFDRLYGMGYIMQSIDENSLKSKMIWIS